MVDQVVTVEVGKMADRIIVDSNPLEDVSALRDARLVLQEGEVVVNQLLMQGGGRP